MSSVTSVAPSHLGALEAPHALAAPAVLDALGSSHTGLVPAEAARRLERDGPNLLDRTGGESALAILWRQVNNPLIYVLLGAAALAIAFGKVTDGLVVLAVVVLNSLIGFAQEYRAGQAIEALSAMVPDTASVVRGGERQTLPAADLVVGDVVVLQSGDKVPADLRLFQLRNLQIDEAALTGESVPATKDTRPVAATATLGDRSGTAYGGTLVTYGAGSGVVTAVGRQTELGRISAMLKTTTHVDTPLTRSIGVVGRWLTIGIMVVALVLFLVGLLRGYSLVDAVLAAITLAVAAIPEGLPAIITIALAIGVQRMAGRRAVIRRLPAVETLGSTTVICSDKTGTLTRNQMTVQQLWSPAASWQVSGVGYDPVGGLSDGAAVVDPPPPAALELARAGLLCNDAELKRDPAGRWGIDGDPTEGALVVMAAKLGLTSDGERNAAPRLDIIPFESEHQFMATLHRSPAGGDVVYMKGAPEVVLERCSHDSVGQPLDRPAVLAAVETLAAHGLRVLGFAAAPHAGTPGALSDGDVATGLAFLGLQAMIDPPRSEAIEAVARCQAAGITVKMITGDHRVTAQAIGEQLGLTQPGQVAVTGSDIATLDDAALTRTMISTNVFARVAPEHKLRLVRILQAQGHVVAMTGDGVNDAPALKQANIGVAMGITGTAVSKESADIVLIDDNFASIAAAVEEGRRVYDNLVKSLAFVLPTNLGEALIILAAVVAFPVIDGQPLLPILPVQILWINLVATVALALPLAFEAMEPNLMGRPPRDPRAPILGRFLLARTTLVAVVMATGATGLFLYEYFREIGAGVDPGLALAEAQTMAVLTVILFQIFYLLHCRSLRAGLFATGWFSNPLIYAGIAALLLLQAAFTYLPIMNALFGSAPLAADDVLKAVAVAALILPLISLEKWVRARRP